MSLSPGALAPAEILYVQDVCSTQYFIQLSALLYCSLKRILCGYNSGSADYPAVFMWGIIATTQWTGREKEGGGGQGIYTGAAFHLEKCTFPLCFKYEPVFRSHTTINSNYTYTFFIVKSFSPLGRHF